METTITSDFIKKLQSTANDEFNRSETENGAVGYRTTGRELLDLNFAVSSLRNMSPIDVVKKFRLAFYEDMLLAVKWLFFAGDVRGGMGERRLFRLCMQDIAQSHPQIVKALLPFIPEYTRWDNLVFMLNTSLSDDVAAIIKAQLESDAQNKSEQKQISLLAKWLPSINATSAETRALAGILVSKLGMTAKQYRQTLSALRKYLNVTEVHMSAGNWRAVKYAEVPSKANLLYANAFMEHDPNRRTTYLNALKRGQTKINAGVLFPHDVVHKYANGNWSILPYDETVEQLWKALPDYVQGDDTTLCVADGSGSMAARVGRTDVSALEIANALAIYFAERCKGQFKDKYITFSENPQIVDFSHCKSLHSKIGVALAHDEVANTNIEAVFDLILTTAVKYKMPQSELPQNVLILSDMEFDWCAVSNTAARSQISDRLFDEIGARYAENGYKLPRLVFWNICSRTLTVPLTTNELGVALVSGFSPTALNMVLSGTLDPYKCLVDQINTPRYDAVENAIKDLLTE